MNNENEPKEESEEKVEILTKFYLRSGAVIEIKLTDLELFTDPDQPGSLTGASWKTKSPGTALEYLRIEDISAIVTVQPVEWSVS